MADAEATTFDMTEGKEQLEWDGYSCTGYFFLFFKSVLETNFSHGSQVIKGKELKLSFRLLSTYEHIRPNPFNFCKG